MTANTYEVEEWLLYALYGETPGGVKPSERLRELTGGQYRKNRLPHLMSRAVGDERTLRRLLRYPTAAKLIKAVGGGQARSVERRKA